jgi:hypothetical protein
MAITRSKNKWLIAICAVIIAIGALWAYNHYTDKKKDTQAEYNCENKTWYKVPGLRFKDWDAAANDTAISILTKRNGTAVSNGLRLKIITNADKKIDYELTSGNPDSALINKADTIYLSFQNEKHKLYGFKSHSYSGDHGIIQCSDEFMMDGKTYNYYDLGYFYKTDKNNQAK